MGIRGMGSDLRLVLTTCSNRSVADELATRLIERRHAACVNVLPGVRSTYRWLGKIERADEVLLLIKTGVTELPAIEKAIKTLAGYELPEVVAVEITGGSSDYLAWLAASIGEPAG